MCALQMLGYRTLQEAGPGAAGLERERGGVLAIHTKHSQLHMWPVIVDLEVLSIFNTIQHWYNTNHSTEQIVYEKEKNEMATCDFKWFITNYHDHLPPFETSRKEPLLFEQLLCMYVCTCVPTHTCTLSRVIMSLLFCLDF